MTENIRLTPPPPNSGDRNFPSQVILNAADFIAGGRGDDATITLDNNQFRSSGINAEVTFPSLDFLHLVSKSNGFPDSQFGRPDENTLRLKATDLDEIRITGDESLSLFITDRPSQIDASGLDAPLGIFFSRETRSSELSPFTVEIRGTSYDDHYIFDNFATETSFLFTGGGSDVVTYSGRTTDKHFVIFTATELNAGDLKAGDATIVNLVDVGVGATVTIELSSALEGLLKSGGTFLSETNANINIHGTSLSNTTNIAAQGFNSVIAVNDNQLITQSTLDLQFDLNGDGNYSASDDAQIRLIASNSDQITINGTLVYDAAADALIYTVV